MPYNKIFFAALRELSFRKAQNIFSSINKTICILPLFSNKEYLSRKNHFI